jgi:N-acylneuraminate cytidylyltransferase
MIEWKYFHGQNPYKFIIDKKQAIDIDDEIDFKIGESLLNI